MVSTFISGLSGLGLCWVVPCDGLASHLGEFRKTPSHYINCDKLQSDGLFGAYAYADLNYHSQPASFLLKI